jgi:hypothetical protein
VWSQPELVLYSRDQSAADPNLYLSAAYPDIIQQDGEVYIAETDKEVMRTHRLDRGLIEMLLRQGSIADIVRDASLLVEHNTSAAAAPGFGVPKELWGRPIAGSDGNASFTIEISGLLLPAATAVPPNATDASFRLVRRGATPVDLVDAATTAPNPTPWLVLIQDDGTAATGCKGPQPGKPSANTCVGAETGTGLPLTLRQCASRCQASKLCNYFWFYDEGRCCPKQSFDLKQGWANLTAGGWYEMVERESSHRDLPLLDCRDTAGAGVAVFAPQAGPGSLRAQPLLSLTSRTGRGLRHSSPGRHCRPTLSLTDIP